jgi:glucans biosynthesis protein
VVGAARELAARDYVGPDRSLPGTLERLSYDDFRRINFRRNSTLLRSPGSHFGLQLFHRGGIFRNKVRVHVVDQGTAAELNYVPGLFDFGAVGAPGGLRTDLGFAGFRLLFPLNRPDKLDELVSFLGASYFRLLGPGQHYGLSARGLALGSGGPHEEFPDFVAFWIEAPRPLTPSITVHALLDSPSVTGAYRFVFAPQADADVQVEATLFPRRELRSLGLAPLTSMFLFGENTVGKPTDFRPEVHDSDGLAIRTSAGEWIWRPLRNPAKPTTSAFLDEAPSAFGLIQRDRHFRSYQDLEAQYHLRPSYWIEPRALGGAGYVALTELTASREAEDNVVACWRPDRAPRAGEELSIAYAIHSATPPLHGGGRAVATFETHVGAATSTGPSGLRRFVIDFAGGRLGSSRINLADLELVATASAGAVSGPTLVRNRAIDGVRASFDVDLPTEQDVDLRAYIRMGHEAVSETWTYRYDVEPPA